MKALGRRTSALGRARAVGRCLLAAAALTSAFPAVAHVLSMSQGSLRLDGQSVRYELRIPLAEAPSDPDRQRILLNAFRVTAGGSEGERATGACHEEGGQELLVCEASYRFAEPPSKVSVRCDLPTVTVPQHVHILRSGEGASARQTVFDITSRESEIRFVPPTWIETVATESGAGMRKALTSPELILFLVALALAGRTRNELLACAGTFLAAQSAVALLAALLAWMPPAGFLESAAALTVAYLAAEVLFLPEARKRWLVCGAMGCFHGLFLGVFLGTAGMSPAYFLPSALGLEAVLAVGAAGLRLRLSSRRSEQLVALLLLVLGLGWFALRVVG
ncbi:MAG: HupE/UreJ family protein [Bryobacterales bacterium]|nr:HupE/UreJ family protein [Bryobacterales bacterium]MDE0625044.1 HupE/UreJ family protein [Bryobacterales bacterium]